MIWSLIKILTFIVVVTGLSYLGSLWIEQGTGFRLQIADWEINPGPLPSVMLIILLFLAVWLVIRLTGFLVAVFRFLTGDETAISRFFDRNRERKGYEALAEGLLAISSGDGRLALAKATRAERFLKRPELTNLLSAQAAELAGDRAKAAEIYKRLLASDKTRFVGIRGLMKQKLESGDTDVALELARRAFSLNARHSETQDTLLKLQAEHEDWSGARETLRTKLRYGSIPRALHKRRDAVLALSDAINLAASPDTEAKSQAAAIEANNLSPDLVPAAVRAARALTAQGKAKQAAKVVRRAWQKAPHPDLAAAFAEIEPEETPAARLKRFQPLLQVHPDADETHMLAAELSLAAEDFPAARKAMGTLVERNPTARALTIMAAIARGEGAEDAEVRGFLAKAVNAPRGPAWICDKCSTTHDDWTPICIRCSALDSLTWRDAPQGDRTMPASTEMLPLIIGASQVDIPDVEEDSDGPHTIISNDRPIPDLPDPEVEDELKN